MNLKNRAARLFDRLADDAGANMVEYTLLVVLIALVTAGSVTALAGALSGAYGAIPGAITG